MIKLIGSKKIKSAIFISGKGSNLKNLIKFSLLKKSPIKVSFVVSDKPEAKGLVFAKKYKIPKEGRQRSNHTGNWIVANQRRC